MANHQQRNISENVVHVIRLKEGHPLPMKDGEFEAYGGVHLNATLNNFVSPKLLRVC
jgi:hypothetical protein